MNLLGYIYRAIQIAPYQGAGTLTPPTVAPFLEVEADLGTFIAKLRWTASNKTSSAGFGYRVYYNGPGSGFIDVGNVLTYDFDAVDVDGLWSFYVVPFNDAGEGPSSNTVSINLPGESSRLLLNAGGNILLNQIGVLLING